MPTTIREDGARLYLYGLPFGAKEEAKRVLGMTGSNWDSQRKQWWVGRAKREMAEKFVAEINANESLPKPEDMNDKRVYAKVKHKGRTYYVIARTMSEATATEPSVPMSVRLATLQEDGPVFWTFAEECQLLKEYHGREIWDGRRGNGKMTVYTTLGSLRDFVTGQREAEAKGVPQCASCHVRSNSLIEDLEDGLMKCHKCCDIPSE